VWAVDEPGTLRVRGCFHQAWTGSHGFIYPLVEGLLGLRPDAPSRSLSFAPHLPDSWPRVALRRLRLGTGWFDVECGQEEGRRRLSVRNDSAADLHVTFGFVLSPAVRVVRVEVNGTDQDLSVLRARATHSDIHALVEAAAPAGAECSAELWWEPGDLVVRIIDDAAAPGGAAEEEQGAFLARASAGGTRSIAVEVFNSGHTAAAAEVRLDTPTGWILDPPPPRTLAVEPDDATRFTASVAVPASAEGYYTFRAWLSSENGLWSSTTAYLPVFPALAAGLDARQVARPGAPFTLRVDAANLSPSAQELHPRVEWPAGWKDAKSGGFPSLRPGDAGRAILSAIPGPAGDSEIRVTIGSGAEARVLRHAVRVVPREKPLVLFSGFLGCPLPADPSLEVVSLPANYALRKPHVLDDLLPLADLVLTSDQHDAVFSVKQVEAMAAFVEKGGRLLLYCCWSAPWGRGFHDTFGSIATGRFPEILPLRMRKGIHHARHVSITPAGKALMGGIAWDTVPPFDHNEAEAREGARVLAVSEAGAPLAAEWTLGKGRVMAISIDCFGFESYVEGLSFDFWAERPRLFLQAVKGLLA
jgi:hypothetical protein